MRIALTVALLLWSSVSHATDKLLQPTDLTYLGAFRVPKTDSGAPNYYGMSYGGSVLAYNAANNSLFISGKDGDQQIAEISIPALVNTSNISAMNTASFVQNLADITEGNLNLLNAGRTDVGVNHAKLGGILEYGGKLLGTSYSYYDGGGLAVYSHFRSGKTLAISGDFEGMFEVGVKPSQVPQAGFVAGYMADVPTAWQSALGGAVLTGQGALSVLGRTSSGPALFAFDPSTLNSSTPAAATPLVYYNLTTNNCVNTGGSVGGDACDNQNIGSYYTDTTLYKSGSAYIGAVFPSGSKSVLITGQYGVGSACYGYGNTNGTAGGGARTSTVGNAEIIAWMDAHATDSYQCGVSTIPRSYLAGNSHACCYDPSNANPGAHAYPYVAYVWAYDADDLARVKTGGRIVDNPSPNLVTPIVENGLTLRPGVSPSSTETYKPWHIKPYTTWQLSLPTVQGGYNIHTGAAAYDPSRKILYVAQVESDNGQGWGYPLIHAYSVNVDGAPPPPTGTTRSLNGSLRGSIH